MAEKKVARRSCNYDTRQMSTAQDNTIIQQQFERGSMIAAVITSIFIGIAMLMWAVCAI